MKVSVFFNRQRTTKEGDIPIYIVVSSPHHRFSVSTGLFSKTVFDGAIFPRTERNYKVKTTRLNQMLDRAEELLLTHYHLPYETLKKIIRSEVFHRQDKTKALYEYIQDFADTKDNFSTKEKYVGTMQKVKEYAPEADLSIDFRWIEGFERHLRQTLAINTTSIHIRNIRAVFNWAIKNEWTTNYPFKKFHITYEQTKKRNLSIESIRYIRDADIDEAHKVCRDIFMLMFYLIGINIIDLCKATPQDLRNGRLEYRRAKTKKLYSIKVEPEAMEIIEKYKGSTRLLAIAEQTGYRNVARLVNEYVGRILPGTTSYYTRHSWATIAYGLGIPKDTISQALGHSMGSEMTEIYIERDERLVDAANRNVLDHLKEG